MDFEYSVIGPMYDVKPIRDNDGNITNSPTYKDGWHVNATGEVPESWLQFEIESPATPLRKNAVQDTRYFVFPGQEVFSNLLEDELSYMVF